MNLIDREVVTNQAPIVRSNPVEPFQSLTEDRWRFVKSVLPDFAIQHGVDQHVLTETSNTKPLYYHRYGILQARLESAQAVVELLKTVGDINRLSMHVKSS